ncbi:MAG: hypothetical protein B6D34_04670 [Candidatus Brocadia sp. UTAMX1]|nr:MAG: hypothetical protein B6D34_04670 [Candidatus Brocadia sp. UTAMX1]
MSYKANGKDCQRCPHFGVCTSSRLWKKDYPMRAELSLLYTGFNIARMITLVGIPTLIVKLQGM